RLQSAWLSCRSAGRRFRAHRPQTTRACSDAADERRDESHQSFGLGRGRAEGGGELVECPPGGGWTDEYDEAGRQPTGDGNQQPRAEAAPPLAVLVAGVAAGQPDENGAGAAEDREDERDPYAGE